MTDPRIPEVGEYVRQYGVLVEIEKITPPVEPVADYIFEDTEARLEARINGKLIRRYSIFNNFYGIGKCVSAAIDEARKHQQWIGESNLEFVVVKMTSRIRMRPTGHEHFYAKEYREFSALKHGCHADLPEDIEEEVWSSVRGYLGTANEETEVSDGD